MAARLGGDVPRRSERSLGRALDRGLGANLGAREGVGSTGPWPLGCDAAHGDPNPDRPRPRRWHRWQPP